MPPADDDVTILVCDCGKRLKAPGARPGRVGRCPACGGTLRFPGEVEPRPTMAPQEPPPRPKPARPKRSSAPIPMGASGPGEDETRNPGRSGKLDPARRAEILDAARQVGRGGILKLPRTTTFGLKDALLYPIFDFAGLMWIVFLPLMLGPPYLAVFYGIPMVLRGGNSAIMLPIVFPMIVVFGFGLGYLSQILSEVLVDSSAGLPHHPRWPMIEFGGIVVSLFQWVCGLTIGLSLGAVPATQFWRRAEAHGLGDRLIAAVLVATGLVYGLMSVASFVLHNDLLALNPFVVLKAVICAGFRYWQTVALAIVFVIVGMLGLEMVDRSSGTMYLPATWLAWAMIVYGGLVVCRSLGMVLHVRREQIGWFPHRERWGVSMDDVDPSIFRDKRGRKTL